MRRFKHFDMIRPKLGHEYLIYREGTVEVFKKNKKRGKQTVGVGKLVPLSAD